MHAPRRMPAPRRQGVLGLVVAGALLPFVALGALIAVAAALGALTGPVDGQAPSGVVAAWWSLLIVLLACLGVLFARYGWAAARAAHWRAAAVVGLVLLWVHALLLAAAGISGALAAGRGLLSGAS